MKTVWNSAHCILVCSCPVAAYIVILCLAGGCLYEQSEKKEMSAEANMLYRHTGVINVFRRQVFKKKKRSLDLYQIMSACQPGLVRM